MMKYLVAWNVLLTVMVFLLAWTSLDHSRYIVTLQDTVLKIIHIETEKIAWPD